MPMPDGTSFYDAEHKALCEYCGDNPERWAEAFCEIAAGQGCHIPVHTMETWFRHAIETAVLKRLELG